MNHFFKGNLHAHSTRSDGDSPAASVVRWYRDAGYSFLALTDHERMSTLGEFRSLENEGFRVVPAEEVSSLARRDARNVAVHVNSFCAHATIGGHWASSPEQALVETVGMVRSAGGLAQVNHPNYEFALTSHDIASLEGTYLLEVANQHPDVHNEGRPASASHDFRESTEEIWDRLLSQGKSVYGVADDDMHDLTRNPGFPPRRPARGWVQVDAQSLEPQELCRALEEGQFYFSTGVEFQEIRVGESSFELNISEQHLTSEISSTHLTFETSFMGTEGVVLHHEGGLHPQFNLDRFALTPGASNYVRAVVTRSDGKKAWTQAFRVR